MEQTANSTFYDDGTHGQIFVNAYAEQIHGITYAIYNAYTMHVFFVFFCIVATHAQCKA